MPRKTARCPVCGETLTQTPRFMACPCGETMIPIERRGAHPDATELPLKTSAQPPHNLRIPPRNT